MKYKISLYLLLTCLSLNIHSSETRPPATSLTYQQAVRCCRFLVNSRDDLMRSPAIQRREARLLVYYAAHVRDCLDVSHFTDHETNVLVSILAGRYRV